MRVGLVEKSALGAPDRVWGREEALLARLSQITCLLTGRGPSRKVDRTYGEVDSGLSLCDSLEDNLSRFSI